MKWGFLCTFSTKNGDIHISTFFAADIFFYHQIQIFACDRLAVYLVQDISWKHACLISWRISKYLAGGYNASGPVLLHHNADTTILAAGALHQGLILLFVIIHGIRIVQSIHQTSVNAVFHLLGVLIKQEILVNNSLDILHFRRNEFQIQIFTLSVSSIALHLLYLGPVVNNRSSDQENPR